MANLEVGDIVLCTVDRIAGTVVFVKIDGHSEGSITLSEIAPGRIRNLREYVVPKKRIVCKIIRITGDRIDLSLRRVTPKDAKEALEKNQLEKNSESIIKSILKEDAEKIISEIKNKKPIYEFLQESKENSKELEKLIGKEKAEKIINIIKTQKKKTFSIKKEINLNSTLSNGITKIKTILGKIKNAEIKYIAAGKYLIETEEESLKKADQTLQEILTEIESQAKKQNMEFSVKGK